MCWASQAQRLRQCVYPRPALKPLPLALAVPPHWLLPLH